jgi:hypothetical protein
VSTVRISVTVSDNATRSISKLISGLRAPMKGKVGAEVIAAARKVIAEEFSKGGWFRPRGGFSSWPKGHDFGDKKAPSTPLGGPSGSIARAWAGGKGGFSRVTDGGAGVLIGVSGSPKFAVHRGGQAPTSMAGFTIVRPKRGQAMRFFLGGQFNAWISAARLAKGLRIPSRPHATDNPKTRAAVVEVIRRSLLASVA